MKIPFDIKYRPQIESGEYKVETGDKKQVRIICWNRKLNHFPIVALAYNAQKDTEIFINASILGEPHTNITSDLLFIVTPEPELSEFEEKVKQLIGSYPCANRENKGSLLYEVRKAATELLAIATEELKKKFVLLHKDDYQTAFDLGKAEALKDLPRWERLYSNENADKIPDFIIPGKALDNRLVHRGFELKITDLEKLPGFND